MKQSNSTTKAVFFASLFCFVLMVFSVAPVLAAPPQDKAGKDRLNQIRNIFDKGRESVSDIDFRELSDFKIKDEDTFKQYTVRLHSIPYDDTTLAYEIYLPDTWKKVALHLENDILVNKKLMSHITQYIAPPISDVRPTVTIQAKRLEYEMDARHWLREHMLVGGFTLTSDVEGKDIRNAAVNFVYVDNETAYVGYARAIFHGNMVTFVRFDVPQQFHKYYKFIQQKSVQSLKMLSPKTGGIEEWKKDYLLGDVIELKYPSSWVRKKPRYNEDGEKTSFELHNQAEKDTVYGLMHFSIIPRTDDTDLKTELKILRKGLEEKYGLEVEKVLKSNPSYGPLQFDYVREEHYVVGFKSDKKIADQEMRLLVMANSDWYVFMYMMTPMEENDFINWARNTRVYDIVKDSLL